MAPRKTKRGSPAPKRSSRKKKDPNAPKKNKSPYLFFSGKRFEEIVEKEPPLRSKVAEVAKIIGAEWAEMSDAQKEPYVKQAEVDKKRYEQEMDNYRMQQQRAAAE